MTGNALVLPMPIANKVPLLVFAHGARNPVDPGSILELSREVAEALKRLIAARRG